MLVLLHPVAKHGELFCNLCLPFVVTDAMVQRYAPGVRIVVPRHQLRQRNIDTARSTASANRSISSTVLWSTTHGPYHELVHQRFRAVVPVRTACPTGRATFPGRGCTPSTRKDTSCLAWCCAVEAQPLNASNCAWACCVSSCSWAVKAGMPHRSSIQGRPQGSLHVCGVPASNL